MLQPSTKPPIPPGADEYGFSLSEEDVVRLMSETTSDSRLGVLKKVADGHAQGQFSNRDLALAEQIFRLMMRDTEEKVRATLAECIKENPYIPRDIILLLAHDIEVVSLPVLQYSEVLSDSDLVDIIRTNGMGKQQAIADRKRVSPKVSAALVDTDRPEVVSRLVNNPGAQIADSSYQKIVTRYNADSEMLSAVSQRPGLPITVVEKLIAVVSDSIAGELEKKYQLQTQELSYESDQTRELATLKLLDSPDISDAEIERLVNQLHTFGRLNSSLIMTALCRGNFRFFEQSVAKLARIPLSNARMLIRDRGSLGFKALYTKADLPESMFQALKLVLAVIHELAEEGEVAGTVKHSNRMVERILYYSDDKEIDNLSYILALIRQNVNH